MSTKITPSSFSVSVKTLSAEDKLAETKDLGFRSHLGAKPRDHILGQRQEGGTVVVRGEELQCIGKDLAGCQLAVEEAASILHHLVEKEILVQLNEEIIIHAEMLKKAEAMIRKAIQKKSVITVIESRDLFSSSRRIVIPLLEYFDKKGVTRRNKSGRILC